MRGARVVFRIFGSGAFALENDQIVCGKIDRIETQGITGGREKKLRVCSGPINYRHEVIANDRHARLRDTGYSVLPRSHAALIGAGPEPDRIGDRNTFHHGPYEARRTNLIPSL